MGIPQATEARRFYRAGKLRLVDARLLLEGERTTGAVYLAGYTVECLLKALLLDGVSAGVRREVLREFRGSRAHSIEWLRGLYRQRVGMAVPSAINRHLTRVASWSTDLRYESTLMRRSEADEFMVSVEAIEGWAEARM